MIEEDWDSVAHEPVASRPSVTDGRLRKYSGGVPPSPSAPSLELLLRELNEVRPVRRGRVSVTMLAEGDIAGANQRAHRRKGRRAQPFRAE